MHFALCTVHCAVVLCFHEHHDSPANLPQIRLPLVPALVPHIFGSLSVNYTNNLTHKASAHCAVCSFAYFVCITPHLSGITSKAFGEKHSTLISRKAADARLEENSAVQNHKKKSGRDNLWHNLGQSCFGKSQLCTISVVALALFVAHAQCWSQLNLAGRVKLWGKVSKVWSHCGTCSTYGKILVNSRKSEQGIFSVVAQSLPHFGTCSTCGTISVDSRKIIKAQSLVALAGLVAESPARHNLCCGTCSTGRSVQGESNAGQGSDYLEYGAWTSRPGLHLGWVGLL